MVSKFLVSLGKTAATVVLTVLLTLWLTGLIMTSVVQSILEEYEIPLQVEPVIYSGVLGYLWGYQNNTEAEATLLEHEDVLLDPDSFTVNNAEEHIPTGEHEGWENPNIDSDMPSVEVLAPVELEEEVEISKNELGEAKDSLSDAEKERLLEIIMEKIPADQWQTISLYLEDGLSEKELLDTQQILAQYLTDAEYRELMAILKKS